MAEPDPRVLFTGYAYGDRLTELYSNAAAFVLPSHLEGLPLTLLEAASYGVPIVASDIAPHLEVLGSEEPGRRLFPSGDEQALAGAIRRSLDDRSEETAGAVRLRDEILRRYQWDEVTRHLEEIYLRAVDGDPAVGTSLGEVQAL
jgi:glycosyltransferase involved in cell wall biosynthesis